MRQRLRGGRLNGLIPPKAGLAKLPFRASVAKDYILTGHPLVPSAIMAMALAAAAFLGALWLVFPIAVGAEFRAAWGLIPLLLAGKILYGTLMFFVTLIMYEKKVSSVVAVYAATLAVSVVLNQVMIPWLYPTGVALTFCLTNLFFTLLIYGANRFYRAGPAMAQGAA